MASLDTDIAIDMHSLAGLPDGSSLDFDVHALNHDMVYYGEYGWEFYTVTTGYHVWDTENFYPANSITYDFYGDFQFGDSLNFQGGTIESFSITYTEEVWTSTQVLSIEGVNISTYELFGAVRTASTTDDRAVFAKMFAGSDKILGSDYSDVLDGYAGNDKVYGYGGNDKIWGGKGNDYLSGMSGNDYLNGGTGADNMRGGSGNDTYIVDNASDFVNESISGSNGVDTVQSTISFNLANTAHVAGAVEKLTLLGSGNINGAGNGLANVITGNTGANILGGAAGNDVINGGLGNDRLGGGAGSDSFVFNTKISSTLNVDTITDFNPKYDTIRLDNAVMAALGTAMDKGEFSANTSGRAHDSSDNIIYETDTGKLFYDSNGTASGGSIHFAALSANLHLTYADFLVI